MAGAMRPVVVLMILASLLFVVDGVLDGVYPGGSGWFGGTAYGLGVLTYVFAVVNAAIAIVIARGSERSLLGRIGLSGFFLLERPVTAFAFGPKSTEAVVVHVITAVVELVILLGAVRVWRLGRSLVLPDLDAAFALDAPSPAPMEREAAPARPGLSRRSAWTIGALVTVLIAALVADGLTAGFVPGGREWGTAGAAAGWVVYLYALVAFAAAIPALYGRAVGLRVLFALALLLFVERAFSPFALRVFEPVSLALHVLGACIALALALATVGALRSRNGGSSPLASSRSFTGA